MSKNTLVRRIEKLFVVVALATMAVLAATVLGGCAPVLGAADDPSQLEADSGLTITIGGSPDASRTILPDMSTAVGSYGITLTRSTSDPNAASYSPITATYYLGTDVPPYTLTTVPVGNWDVEVTGFDGSSQAITSGSATEVVVADPGGGTVTVTMSALQSVNGTINLDYTFPANEIDGVVAVLDDGTTPTTLPMTVDSPTGTATYTGSHPSGFYDLRVEFHLGGQTRAITIESAHLYDYQETPHLLTLTAGDLGTAPAAPTTLGLSEVSPGAIEISWADNSSYETGYVVERSTNSFATVDGTLTTGPNETSALMSNLLPGVFYYFRVKAQNDFGDSAYLAGDLLTSTVPMVSGSTPVDGTTDFPVSGPVTITFNTPMEPAITAGAVSVAQGPAIVPTTTTWLSSTQLEVVPVGGTWPRAYAPYSVVIGADVRSTAGVSAAAATTVGFSTGGPIGELDPAFGASGQLTIFEVLGATTPDTDTAVGMEIGLDGTVYVVGTSYEEFLTNYGAYVFAIDHRTGGPAYGADLVYAEVSMTNGEDMWGKDIAVDGYGDLVIATDFTPPAPDPQQATFLSRGARGETRTIFAGGTSGIELSGTIETSTSEAIAYSESENALYTVVRATNDIHIMKYAYSGPDAAALDTSFGVSVFSTFGVPSTESLRDIAVDESFGVVYLVGESAGAGSDLWIVKMVSSTGNLYTTFDGDGIVYYDQAGLNDRANAVAVDSSGRIVVVGQTDTGAGSRMAVWRFNGGDGSLDTSFASSGVFIAGDLSGSPAVSNGSAVAIDAAGNIVVGGAVDIDTTSQSAIWRLTSDGALDTSFNASATGTAYAGGMIFNAGGDDNVTDIKVHPLDQSIIASGLIVGADTDGYVVRVR